MKRLAALLLVAVSIPLFAQTSSADPPSVGVPRLMGIINSGGTVVIPPEWDGIWASEDSTYDCLGVFQDFSTSTDTLCMGAAVVDSSEFEGVPFKCTGSADATTVDVTCVGSETDIGTGCTVTYTWNIRGTRTGGTFFVVLTVTIDFSGPFPCDLVSDQCLQSNIHSTRTGPAPPTYCATPVVPSSWGQLKLLYR